MAIKTEEDFISKVKEAERDSQLNPKGYTIKLALFALLGYAVICLVLLALLGLAGGLIASAFLSTGLFLLLVKKKLILLVVFGIWVLLRALWVKFTPPEGYKLSRKDYPELFAEIDTLAKQLNSLKIHEVILDKRLNAAVVQHPRLGVLGWNKNYLILGYQLLLTLSPEEMRSVLAHEFGHLSGNHSRFAGWIYRVRLTWLRVMEAFDRVDSWGGRLMAKFFDWYSPQFQAYSFALARNNEYEADTIAAKLTSPEIASGALINLHATAPYLEEKYWDNYFKYADQYAEPPHAPFAGLAGFLKDNPMAQEELQERITKEMEVETHYADTHPSLKDRVDALGRKLEMPVNGEINAAEAWLGHRNQTIMEDFDQEWLKENHEGWRQRNSYVLNAKESLTKFAGLSTAEMNDEDLWSYAYWTNEFKDNTEALPLFNAFQERHPEDPDVAWFIGFLLLKQGDASGLEHLRKAQKSAALIEQSAHVGYDFLKEQGSEKEAEAWWEEAVAQNKIFQAAHEERENININDELISPEIDEALLEALTENLNEQVKVGKAWLAQKVIKHFPDDPVYLIAFDPKGFTFSPESIQEEVAGNLDVKGTFFVVCKSGEMKKMAKKVIKAGDRIV